MAVPLVGAWVIVTFGWPVAMAAVGIPAFVVGALILLAVRETGTDRAAALAHGSVRAGFAAVLREHAHEYFEMPERMDMPFMLLVPRVRPEKRGTIPAVTHEDGTGRVQTVTEEHNGRYYRLIRAFHRLTGVPVVINTSFNVRGEPIVCSPQDAYHTFVNTGIDALVIGDFIVTHKPSRVDYDAGMKRSVALEAGRKPADHVTVR